MQTKYDEYQLNNISWTTNNTGCRYDKHKCIITNISATINISLCEVYFSHSADSSRE